MIVVAAIAAVAPVAGDAIAPPLGVAIQQTTEQARDDGREQRSFRIARTLLFAEESNGFRLTVTLISATATAAQDERDRYRAANAPLIDRPIVMHLDRTGLVRSIDDLPAVWRDWTAGLTAAAPVGRSAGADVLRARLDALSTAQRQVMIASIAADMFAAPADRVPAAPRPVTLASPPPFTDLMLSGTTTATADSDGVRIRMAATGHSPATAPQPQSVSITSQRVVDPARGLVVASERRESLTVRGAKLVTTTSTKLSW